MDLLLVAVLGLVAGCVAGVFGVGGGVVFVPTLTLVVGLTQLQAEATSLVAIIPVAMLGTWRQRNSGEVRWRDAGLLGVAAVATSVAGALLADALPQDVLRYAFAAFLLVVAVQLVARARATPTGR